MATLRWPDGRGRFVDHNADRTPGDIDRLEVDPGTTIDVDDADVVDHYLDRGFVRVDDGDDGGDDQKDGSGGDADAAESADSDGFDADAFTDRTPVSDVVDDIEAGDADGHLDAVADADDRVTIQQAVEDRKDDIGGD